MISNTALSLCAIALIGLMSVARVVVPAVQRTYNPPDGMVIWVGSPERDPRLGEHSKRLLGRDAPDTIVICMSDCGPCIQDRLLSQREALSALGRRVLFAVATRPSASDVAFFERALPEVDTQVVELTDSIASSLNAYFVPRVYFFDERGRLAFIQPTALAFADALREVAHLVE
ncbi:MAG: hypothetical protein KatS3mg015_0498 [Fimbriimonadales bacterium]|nr:MAG: hypothetical protein KatS3mg015_0498 [Fimbriimonadales bacterium]